MRQHVNQVARWMFRWTLRKRTKEALDGKQADWSLIFAITDFGLLMEVDWKEIEKSFSLVYHTMTPVQKATMLRNLLRVSHNDEYYTKLFARLCADLTSDTFHDVDEYYFEAVTLTIEHGLERMLPRDMNVHFVHHLIKAALNEEDYDRCSFHVRLLLKIISLQMSATDADKYGENILELLAEALIHDEIPERNVHLLITSMEAEGGDKITELNHGLGVALLKFPMEVLQVFNGRASFLDKMIDHPFTAAYAWYERSRKNDDVFCRYTELDLHPPTGSSL